MLECKDNKDRTKKDYASVANILDAISGDKSLVIFNTIAIESNEFLISKANLTCKQYYSRISNLIKSDLISRKNKRYFLISFGKIVYNVLKRIEVADHNHWKLKAIDSIESSDNHELPEEDSQKSLYFVQLQYIVNYIIRKYLIKIRSIDYGGYNIKAGVVITAKVVAACIKASNRGELCSSCYSAFSTTS